MQQKNILYIIIIVLLIAVGILLWRNQSQDKVESAETNTNTAAQVNTNSSEPVEAEPETPAQSQNDFEADIKANGSNWVVWKATLNSKPVNLNVNVPAPLTLQFDTSKNTYTGFSGCNNFSGTYTLSEVYGFSFGSMAMTKKACPSSMELEAALGKVMSAAATYGIKGEQLVFTSKDGYTEIVFNKAI